MGKACHHQCAPATPSSLGCTHAKQPQRLCTYSLHKHTHMWGCTLITTPSTADIIKTSQVWKQVQDSQLSTTPPNTQTHKLSPCLQPMYTYTTPSLEKNILDSCPQIHIPMISQVVKGMQLLSIHSQMQAYTSLYTLCSLKTCAHHTTKHWVWTHTQTHTYQALLVTRCHINKILNPLENHTDLILSTEIHPQ